MDYNQQLTSFSKCLLPYKETKEIYVAHKPETGMSACPTWNT